MASSRLLNSVIQDTLPGTPTSVPHMDLTKGGQFGYIPRIGTVDIDGKVKSELINNTSYIRRDLIPILMDYPRFYDYLPSGTRDMCIKTLKSLIEDRPIKIDGLNPKISVESEDTPIGASGEVQSEPTKVKQDHSTLTFEYNEVINKSIQRFIEFNIRFGIGNQHTNIPLITHYLQSSEIEYAYTLDFYTFTIALIEPDPLAQYAVDGFICTNCWFKEPGDKPGSRDIAANKEKLTISTTFDPITTNEPLTVYYCDQLLKNINILKQKPYDIMLPANTEIDPNIKAFNGNVGFDRGV